MKTAVWIWIGLSCFSVSVLAETLTIYLMEKPPYSYTKNGKPEGFLWDKAEKIFKKAGIQYQVSSRPPQRLIYEIENGNKPICSPGWFKTEDREKEVWFSSPLYRDKPGAIVIRREDEQKFAAYKNPFELAHEKNMVLGLLKDVSYGKQIDDLFKTRQGITVRVTGSFQTTLSQVAYRRIDWTLVNQEEFEYFKSIKPREAELLMTNPYFKTPRGATRHIMCSKNLGTELKNKIEAAIKKDPIE